MTRAHPTTSGKEKGKPSHLSFALCPFLPPAPSPRPVLPPLLTCHPSTLLQALPSVIPPLGALLPLYIAPLHLTIAPRHLPPFALIVPQPPPMTGADEGEIEVKQGEEKGPPPPRKAPTYSLMTSSHSFNASLSLFSYKLLFLSCH